MPAGAGPCTLVETLERRIAADPRSVMRRNKRLRNNGKALSAAFLAWGVPFLLSAYTVMFESGVDLKAQPDNAPIRGATLLILFSPIAILLLAVYFAVLAFLLERIRVLSLGSLLTANAIVSVLISGKFASERWQVGGASDAALGFLIFGLGCLGSLSLGSLAWRKPGGDPAA